MNQAFGTVPAFAWWYVGWAYGLSYLILSIYMVSLYRRLYDKH